MKVSTGSWKKRAVSVALVGAMAAGSSGCFGKFALTQKLYGFNASIGGSNKLVQNIVFWLLLIVPIYEIAGALDLLILNLLEFWTGSNPLMASANAPREKTVSIDGKSVHFVEVDGGRSVDATIAGRTYRFTRDTTGYSVTVDGQRAATADLLADGSVEVRDASNTVVAMHAPDEVASVNERLKLARQGVSGLPAYAVR